MGSQLVFHHPKPKSYLPLPELEPTNRIRRQKPLQLHPEDASEGPYNLAPSGGCWSTWPLAPNSGGASLEESARPLGAIRSVYVGSMGFAFLCICTAHLRTWLTRTYRISHWRCIGDRYIQILQQHCWHLPAQAYRCSLNVKIFRLPNTQEKRPAQLSRLLHRH